MLKHKINKISNYVFNRRFYSNFLSNLRTIRRIKREPIIICGCPRSGTTLLMSVLDSHPDIHVIPYETTILQKRKKKERIFKNKYLHYKFIKAQVIAILFSEKIKPMANRWCEKTPLNILNIPEIDDIYKGKVKFIYIQRDGRAVVSSHHRNYGYMVSPEIWKKNTLEGEKFQNKHNFHTLKYENLVLNEHKALNEIAAFLELERPFDKKWYAHTRIKGNIKRVLDGKVEGSLINEKINPASLNKWKTSKSPHLKKFLNNPEFIEFNRKLGYE